jgi:hypothetical protein
MGAGRWNVSRENKSGSGIYQKLKCHRGERMKKKDRKLKRFYRRENEQVRKENEAIAKKLGLKYKGA